jgi:dTDP-4-dehydrorhamnose 3,5-epimerase-like enzyme
LSVDDCKLLELPVVHNPQGNLTFIEGSKHVPFDIARVYYLYDVPGGATRGGHAHRQLEQLVIAISGSLEIVLDDGTRRRGVRLNRSYVGLYLPPMTWRELVDFSSGSVCMVLASADYDESDYIRDYNEFQNVVAPNDGAPATVERG